MNKKGYFATQRFENRKHPLLKLTRFLVLGIIIQHSDHASNPPLKKNMFMESNVQKNWEKGYLVAILSPLKLV